MVEGDAERGAEGDAANCKVAAELLDFVDNLEKSGDTRLEELAPEATAVNPCDREQC